MDTLAGQIYKILTSKKHRCGGHDIARKERVVKNIEDRIFKNEPIKILQFWGGAKNPNLDKIEADLCEEKSLEHLFQIHKEISAIYPSGLLINICTGGKRVEFVNNIPHERVLTYHRTFSQIINKEKFHNIFYLIPISKLYGQSKEFWIILEKTYNEVKKTIDDFPPGELDRIFRDAGKNVFLNDSGPKEFQIREAAIKYISVMISEEKAKIYQPYENFIRSFFIKFSLDYGMFYEKYMPNQFDCFLTSKCSLYFYTEKKGNITQPWQAVWKNGFFTSQEKLRKLRIAQ